MGEGSRRRSRSGGGAARRAERTAVSVETERYIDRKIPLYELFDGLSVPNAKIANTFFAIGAKT